ncbi:hypothetical protein [Actinomadura atramentaria]|uniref:hypothetical protein n=1 Tax=Actinomadura atramentaria TaxID=1990 RepID=UPI00036772B5|nr:hypothetical protein [Actinomadura atramentaria]
MDSSLYAFAEDLRDEGFARVLACGTAGVAVAAAYHRARDVTPHGRTRVTLRHDGVHFPLGDAFDGLRLRPPVQDGASARPLRAARAAADAAGARLHGWGVFLHNTTIGLAHPDVTQENCFGDRGAPADLCPSHPDVRAYAVALARSIARLGVDSVVAESLHFGTFGHGYHHERSFVELGEAAEFALGLCFCPHCLKRSTNGAAARATAAQLVEAVLNGDPPTTAMPNTLPNNVRSEPPRAGMPADAALPDASPPDGMQSDGALPGGARSDVALQRDARSGGTQLDGARSSGMPPSGARSGMAALPGGGPPEGVPGGVRSGGARPTAVLPDVLLEYARERIATVTSLAAEVAAAVAAEGSRLTFLDLTGAVKGYADGRPGGGPAAADAWRIGVDPAALARVVPSYAALCYARDAERVALDVAAYRAALGPDVELRTVLRPGFPDTDSAEHLAAKASAARGAGTDAVDFYCYGLAPRPALERIAGAVRAAGQL